MSALEVPVDRSPPASEWRKEAARLYLGEELSLAQVAAKCGVRSRQRVQQVLDEDGVPRRSGAGRPQPWEWTCSGCGERREGLGTRDRRPPKSDRCKRCAWRAATKPTPKTVRLAARVAELRAENLTSPQIARRLRITEAKVAALVAMAGVAGKRWPKQRQEEAARVDERARVAQALQDTEGLLVHEIGERLGVSRITAGKYVRRGRVDAATEST